MNELHDYVINSENWKFWFFVFLLFIHGCALEKTVCFVCHGFRSRAPHKSVTLSVSLGFNLIGCIKTSCACSHWSAYVDHVLDCQHFKWNGSVPSPSLTISNLIKSKFNSLNHYFICFNFIPFYFASLKIHNKFNNGPNNMGIFAMVLSLPIVFYQHDSQNCARMENILA